MVRQVGWRGYKNDGIGMEKNAIMRLINGNLMTGGRAGRSSLKRISRSPYFSLRGEEGHPFG
jgi:hypothetical protein